MHISKALGTIAPIAPAAVEFHIHHVVPAFHNNMLRKLNKKKRFLFGSLSAISNNGIQAKNIRKVKDESGHADTNNNPETML